LGRVSDRCWLVVATHGGPQQRQPDIDRQELWDLFGKETVVDFFFVERKPDEHGNRKGIDGLEHTRRDALSAIRYQLDEIHGSIKGLDAQKRVPIPEAPNADPLDYDYLLQLERDGFDELPVKNGDRLVKVNVRKLLSGVVSETERRQSAGSSTNIYIGGDVKGGTIIAGDENEVKK